MDWFFRKRPEKSVQPGKSGRGSVKNYNPVSVTGVEQYPDGTFFFPIPSNFTTFGTGTIEDQRLAYQLCAPVTSVIGRKVSAHLARKWYIQNAEGKEVNSLTANKFKTLIDRPNPFQNGKKFEAQARTFMELFGECFILTPTGLPGNMESVKRMWVIPNWMIKPVYTGKVYFQTESKEILTGYKLRVANNEYDIPETDILRIQDIYINTGTNGNNVSSFLDGQSRLGSLNDQVNLIIKAYEANTELIVNHGAMGVISPKAAGTGAMTNIPMPTKEKEALQLDFQKYGIQRGKWKYILSNIALDFSQISANVKDLMLMESIKEAVRQIAECYGVPMELLGYPEGTTFTNVNEAKKSLYDNEIIPTATTYTEAFGNHFQLYKNGLYYNMYYDHLEIFQKSKADEAAALKTFNEAKQIEFNAGILTAQEWKEQIQQFQS